MHCSSCEPTLSDALTDRVVQALMRADGVEADRLEALLREMADKLANDHAFTRSPA